MEVNPFCLPETHSQLYTKHGIIGGSQWRKECIRLAAKISTFSEKNWLLYEDDALSFSINFFALLLANKNIVLAQSGQSAHLLAAVKNAEIVIGNHTIEECRHFNSKQVVADNDIRFSALNENIEITFFTSGSTGSAKPIKKYWYQLANEVVALEQLWGQQTKNTWVVATVSHKHIYGLLYKLLWPIFTNKNIVIDSQDYPEQINELILQFDRVMLVSSPAYLNRTLKQHSNTDHIAAIYSSGGPLPEETSRTFYEDHKIAIDEVYGSTETGAIAWRRTIESHLWTLLEQHSVELADDKTLLLTSPFLIKGEILKTDDVVKLNGRNFELLGRIDRIVKLQEKRLSLDELEQRLKQHPAVDTCACLILKNDKRDVLGVALTLNDGHIIMDDNHAKRQLVQTLKQHLSVAFEPSLMPKKWRFINRLPLNSQGKLRAADLLELFNGS